MIIIVTSGKQAPVRGCFFVCSYRKSLEKVSLFIKQSLLSCSGNKICKSIDRGGNILHYFDNTGIQLGNEKGIEI